MKQTRRTMLHSSAPRDLEGRPVRIRKHDVLEIREYITKQSSLRISSAFTKDLVAECRSLAVFRCEEEGGRSLALIIALSHFATASLYTSA